MITTSFTFWMWCFLAAAVLFVLPMFIAVVRGVQNLPLVIWLNALGLVVPVFGWGAAMAIACFGETGRPVRPRRRRAPRSAPAPAVYDPGSLRGTPFEALARYRYLAGQGSGVVPPER